MTTPIYPVHERSIARPIALVLALVSVGYVAGAVLQGTPALRDGASAFARSVQAAEPREQLSTSGPVPAADAVEWGGSNRERISEPRECDVAKGLSTACLFMD